MKGRGSGEDHLPAESIYSDPLKAVLIVGQDHKIPKVLEMQFQEQGHLQIGNGITNLKLLNASFSALKNRIDNTTRIYIWSHGSVNNDIHSVDILTKALLQKLAGYSRGKPLNIHLLCCYASAAALDVTALPVGSVLVTHGSPSNITYTTINSKTILQSSQDVKSTSLLQDFIHRFPLYLKYATTVSIHKKQGIAFRHTITHPKNILTIVNNIQSYLEAKRAKFIKAYEQEFSKSAVSSTLRQITLQEAKEWCTDILLYTTLSGGRMLLNSLEKRLGTFSKYIDGTTYGPAFISATKQGNEKLAFAFLASPAIKPNIKDSEGLTAFIWAAIKGFERIISAFLASPKIKPNSKDNNRKTALMWAASQPDNEKSVSAIVASKRVKTNLKDKNGFSALMLAVIKCNKTSVSTLLLSGNVKPNIQNKKGFTAFILAAYIGDTDILSVLLESDRVKTNLKDVEGRTALVWAVIQGRVAAVSVLLDSNKVDVHSKDNKGWTALAWAEYCKNTHIILLIEAHILKQELAALDSDKIEQVTSLMRRTPGSPKTFDLPLSSLNLTTISTLAKHIGSLDVSVLSEAFLQEQILQAQNNKENLDMNCISSTGVKDEYTKAQAVEELCFAILATKKNDAVQMTRRRSLTALDVLASYSDSSLSTIVSNVFTQPCSNVLINTKIPVVTWQRSCSPTNACGASLG